MSTLCLWTLDATVPTHPHCKTNLVDLNRVCDPESVRVDELMRVEKYAHVMHIVSHVSGTLRPCKTRFDAFRSVFPAGTLSGITMWSD